MGVTSGSGTACPSGALEFKPCSWWGSCYSIFSFMCMFCRSLFVLLSFFLINHRYLVTIPHKSDLPIPKLTRSFINVHCQREEFEDTKVAIRIRISKKNRKHNGQRKKDKRTKNDLQNIHIKLKYYAFCYCSWVNFSNYYELEQLFLAIYWRQITLLV
jgi:hypothetical protein